MAKKGTKSKQSAIPHKEAMLRMNFLYQAAHATADNITNSRYYVNTMKTIAKRLVLRIDPSIKRTICKRCNTLLIPGKTSSSRLRARREKHVVVRCLTCGMVKRFKTTPPGYTLWCDRNENIFTPQELQASCSTSQLTTKDEPHVTQECEPPC